MGTTTITEGEKTLTQRVDLDPGINGQKFMVRVTSQSGGMGTYWINIYRDTQGQDPKFQTRIIGMIIGISWDENLADVTLYKKSDDMGFQSVMDATSGASPLVSVPNDATYAERFDMLVTSGHLTPECQTYSDRESGAFTMWPTGNAPADFTGTTISEPGTYMLVVSRPGYLDGVVDNVRLYNTYTKVERNFNPVFNTPGDTNNDGVIDQTDRDFFTQYLTSIGGIDNAGGQYYEMAQERWVEHTAINGRITETSWDADVSAKDFAWDVELRSNAAGGVFNITGLDIVYTASDNSETASFTDTLDHLEQYKVNFYYSDSPNVTGISRYNATNQLLPDRVSENLLVPGQPLSNDLKDGDEVYIYMDYQFIGITPFIRVGRLRVNDDALYLHRPSSRRATGCRIRISSSSSLRST